MKKFLILALVCTSNSKPGLPLDSGEFIPAEELNRRTSMSKKDEALELALDAKSIAGILLREHDNVEQAINYAERMAQRCADSRGLMAMEYQDAAKELKAWKQNKPR